MNGFFRARKAFGTFEKRAPGGVQPVFTSRKISQEFPTGEPNHELIDQQWVAYINSNVTIAMLVMSDTPMGICLYLVSA